MGSISFARLGLGGVAKAAYHETVQMELQPKGSRIRRPSVRRLAMAIRWLFSGPPYWPEMCSASHNSPIIPLLVVVLLFCDLRSLVSQNWFPIC